MVEVKHVAKDGKHLETVRGRVIPKDIASVYRVVRQITGRVIKGHGNV